MVSAMLVVVRLTLEQGWVCLSSRESSGNISKIGSFLLSICQNGYFSLMIAKFGGRGGFSGLHHENLVGLLEVKPTEVWWLPLSCSQKFLTSSQSTLNFQENHLSVPTCYWLQQLLLQVSYYVFSVLACLFRFWGGHLFYDLDSPMSLRKVLGFQFLKLFFFLW